VPGDLTIEVQLPDGRVVHLAHCEFYVQPRVLRKPEFYHYNHYSRTLEIVTVVDKRGEG
jgi:hypothetical protein